MLPVKAHTETLAVQFLAGSSQSHRVDHKTTSSTSLRPMRLTLNDTYRDRVKQHKKIKRAIKLQRIQKCAQKYPPKHHPYWVQQRQQATSYTHNKDGRRRRRTNAATNCTYPISTTENWIPSPAKLLLE